MSKKALTMDLTTGTKKLETIIDDTLAIGNEQVSYSGKFIDDTILSVNHDSHIIGDKVLNDNLLYDKFVITYNSSSDNLVYQNVDKLIQTVDCGYF